MTVHELLAVVVALSGCVSRTPIEVTVESDGGVEPSTAANAPEPQPSWRSLADRDLGFSAPKPLSLDELGDPPTELPSASDGPLTSVEKLPIVVWPRTGTYCYPPSVPAFCSYTREDAAGRTLAQYRVEREAGQVSVLAVTDATGYVTTLEHCTFDSHGRVTTRQVQLTNRWDDQCRAWRVRTITEGYDDHGGLVFSQSVEGEVLPGRTELSGVESGATIYQPSYENGRATRVVAHEVSLDFGYSEILFAYRYQWEEGRPVRFDRFVDGGAWDSSSVLTWSGEHLRIDRFTPQVGASGSIGNIKIYARRGPGDYAQVYEAPDTHWERVIADGVETSTKFVGELVVERRRFAVAEGERRPLSVEQRLPDVEGLATVEQWDWSNPDRVVVQRHDGRDVYLLDCSELPPIDDLVDPKCPPPRPIR